MLFLGSNWHSIWRNEDNGEFSWFVCWVVSAALARERMRGCRGEVVLNISCKPKGSSQPMESSKRTASHCSDVGIRHLQTRTPRNTGRQCGYHRSRRKLEGKTEGEGADQGRAPG